MSNIAFIPVRGGSKSIPYKNIKPLAGKPLVYWIIKTASDLDIIDKVVVATEDQTIKDVVLSFNLPKVEIFNRNPANAQDTSPTDQVLKEYVDSVNFQPDDLMFFLQATSPLTSTSDIYGIYKKYKAENADSALSCVREYRFYWTDDGHEINHDYHHRPRRQDYHGVLMENGAIRLIKLADLKRQNGLSLCGKICVYEMPHYTSVELDTPDDWIVVENLIRKYKLLQETPENC